MIKAMLALQEELIALGGVHELRAPLRARLRDALEHALCYRGMYEAFRHSFLERKGWMADTGNDDGCDASFRDAGLGRVDALDDRQLCLAFLDVFVFTRLVNEVEKHRLGEAWEALRWKHSSRLTPEEFCGLRERLKKLAAMPI